MLLRGAIFPFVAVVEDGEVGVVARLGDTVVSDGTEDGTARFMGMGAVPETAVGRLLEDFREVMGDLVGLHFDGTEAAYPRSVYYPATEWEGKHLREGRGMSALVMDIRNRGSPQVKSRNQGVDEGGFPNPGISGY